MIPPPRRGGGADDRAAAAAGVGDDEKAAVRRGAAHRSAFAMAPDGEGGDRGYAVRAGERGGNVEPRGPAERDPGLLARFGVTEAPVPAAGEVARGGDAEDEHAGQRRAGAVLDAEA